MNTTQLYRYYLGMSVDVPNNIPHMNVDIPDRLVMFTLFYWNYGLFIDFIPEWLSFII